MVISAIVQIGFSTSALILCLNHKRFEATLSTRQHGTMQIAVKPDREHTREAFSPHEYLAGRL